MDLTSVLGSVAKKLLIDFEEVTSEIEHRGLKGTAREAEIVEQFLARYLPPKVALGRGEIVSSDGRVSNECDVVVYDRMQCPTLLQKSGSQIFPVESVYGVLEVKSKLDTRELRDACQKIHNIKSLPKIAYEPQTGAVLNCSRLYGEEWSYFPTVGFVFAYDSIDLTKIRAELVCRIRDTRKHAGVIADEGVGLFGPDERGWILVPRSEKGLDVFS